LHAASKAVWVVALLAVVSFSVSAQTGLGRIGPSGAQVAGAAIGVAAVTVLVLYVTLHKPSITGCVQSANGTTSLMDKKNNLSYTLVNTNAEIKPGERVKLFGKKKKDKDGHLSFRVKKLKQDYGPCDR
jgi:hypothetical protein